jgi:flagellar biosynthesis protein FliQ
MNGSTEIAPILALLNLFGKVVIQHLSHFKDRVFEKLSRIVT